MLIKEIQRIFEKVQATSSCHQKCVIVLLEIYKRCPRDDFIHVFLLFLQEVVRQNIQNFLYTKRVLNFISQFSATITKKEEKETETHDFFTLVIRKILQWSSLSVYDIRYNCCYFIATVLQDIGEEVQLEINLIDEIQEVLLQRMQETKIPIRTAAMSALVRLQDPQNFECPVVHAYAQALSSGSSVVRRDATDKIAPNMITLGIIKDRIRDCDSGVRMVAFHKCADIGPLNFRIVDKHTILMCGFKETDEKVKDTFINYLLPKWLTAYKGDFLKFVGALKLIADEEDVNKMTYLSSELIKYFYHKHPIDDLISVLPVNEDKVINVENLSNDVTLFWNILVGLLRESDDMDEYLNQILPELTTFCHYIDGVIKTKSKVKMDEWKHFEYHFDLLNLFEIAENYDFSDEVGRRTMQSFSVAVLESQHFTGKLVKKIITIAHKCSSNIDFFTHDMCQLISDIREPLIEEPLSQDQLRERDFKVAELRVKINVLKERQVDAVSERNYAKAQELDTELVNHNQQLEELQNQTEGEKIRVIKSDSETLCRCLDILASVLELPSVSKMTPVLMTCKDHFLIPLISNQEAEVHWRIIKCLGLFSIIDESTAREFAKLICIPITTYRTIPVNNVSALIQSISSVTDLISLYGVKIVGPENEVNNTTTDQNSIKRKLYKSDREEDLTSNKVDNMTLSYIFEIFLDLLDDERDEIRHKTVLAIAALVKYSFQITPTILSRILLKWYNPVTEKQDSRLQIYLGLLIERFMRTKNSGEVMKEAILPTLTSITRAPKTSPLVDIDIDNVVLFFAETMNIHLQKDDSRILALDICMKISENGNLRLVACLSKLLCLLDMQYTTLEAMTELMERASDLLENLNDKMPRKYVEKFLSKLRRNLELHQTNTTVNQSQQTSEISRNETQVEKIDSIPLREVSTNNDHNVTKESQQVKRRKSRKSGMKECVVVLEKISTFHQNETVLHTIIETSQEMEIDEDLTISSLISDSSKRSKRSATRTNSIVVSETSDSDSCGEVAQRRSNRCRKKRIL